MLDGSEEPGGSGEELQLRGASGARYESRVLLSLLAAVVLVGGCRTAPPLGSPLPSTEDSGGTPIQLSVTSALQTFDRERDVTGLRLSLFSVENRDVAGVDLALGQTSALRDVAGIQITGLGHLVQGDATGIQLAGLMGAVGGDLLGIQVSGVANVAGSDLVVIEEFVEGQSGAKAGFVKGVQIAPFNVAGDLAGAQLGFFLSFAKGLKGLQFAWIFNWIEAKGQGVQIGGLNFMNEDSQGLQVGVFNSVEFSFSGLQIGLINGASSMTGVQIGLLNINGAGLLPIAPFFNFGVASKRSVETESGPEESEGPSLGRGGIELDGMRLGINQDLERAVKSSL